MDEVSKKESMKAFNDANNDFVDENYVSALENYDLAITLDNTNPEFYIKRSACNLKISNLLESLEDINWAIKLDDKDSKSWTRKGTILFEFGEFESASCAFKKAVELNPSLKSNLTWLRKCDVEKSESEEII